jgi:hypothetical protein
MGWYSNNCQNQNKTKEKKGNENKREWPRVTSKIPVNPRPAGKITQQ